MCMCYAYTFVNVFVYIVFYVVHVYALLPWRESVCVCVYACIPIYVQCILPCWLFVTADGKLVAV